MKRKTWFGFLAMLLAGFGLAAAEIDINGDFETVAGALPARWMPNNIYKNGTLTVTEAETGKCVRISTPGDKAQYALMLRDRLPAKAGDQLFLTIAVRGSGQFNFGVYCYTAAGKWVGRNLLSKRIQINDDAWKTAKFEIAIPAVEKDGEPLARIVPVFTVLPGSDLSFDRFTLDHRPADAPAPVAAPAAAPAAPAAAPAPAFQTAGGAPSFELVLPKAVYAVVGEEMSVYFDNLTNLADAAGYTFVAESPVGRLDADRWRLIAKPAEAGRHSLTVKAYDAFGREVAAATTEVVVTPKEQGSERKIDMLLIGDSLTDAAVYPRRLFEKMRGDGGGGAFRLIGSHAGRGKEPEPDFAVEGYGGWRYITFFTQWTDADNYRAKSRFLKLENGQKKFDPQGYFDRVNGGKVPEVITVFLGVNDIAGAKADALDRAIAESLRYTEKMIVELTKAAPKALIGIALIPPPAASQDAFGANYGTRINRLQYRKNQWALMTAVLNKYAADPRISLIPVYTNLDCRAGYPTRAEAVFAGSQQQLKRASNAVHPNDEGYGQIADTFRAWLKANLK